MKGLGALLAHSACGSHADAAGSAERNSAVEYGRDTLGAGIRSRYVDNNNGVTMHVLEAGFELPGRRCVLLLHGFPELAYCIGLWGIIEGIVSSWNLQFGKRLS